MLRTVAAVARRVEDGRRKLALLLSAGVVIAIIQVTESVLFGRVIDALVNENPVFHLLSVWLVLGALGIGLNVSNALAADRLAHRNKLRTLSLAFEATLSRPPSSGAADGMGAMIRTILMGSDSFFHVWLNLLREFVPALAALVILLPVAFAISVTLSVTLFVLMAAYLAATLFIMFRTQGDQRSVDRQFQGLSSRLSDVITNANTVHAFTRLHHEVRALRDMARTILSKQYPVLNWWAVLNVFTQASATIAIVSVLLVGSFLVGRGTLSIGEVVTFSGFATLLIARLQQAASAITRLYPAVPVMEELLGLLRNHEASSSEERDKPDLAVTRGDVHYEGVSYTFPGTSRGLDDVSFNAPAGSVTAIVGATGSGKTTMLSLLQRIINPDEGRILIDGTDIAACNGKSVRRTIAVVAQSSGLFDRSVADNLRIASPEASEEDMLTALAQAQLGTLLDHRKEGLEFRIGEGGSRLSGGERQRLAIARALLKPAAILILDEATSALDTVTEAKIQKAIEEASKGRTTFIIAHRLSTIESADHVLVLEDGKIVQQGSPETLKLIEGPFKAFQDAAQTDKTRQMTNELDKLLRQAS
jgi:ATP-binding cassette subfamily B protein